MFDVGFSELVLLFIIGLLVLGPQRLPKVAAEVGKWVGRARRTATQLRRQLEREIELADIQNPPPPNPPSAAASNVPEQNPFVTTVESTAAAPSEAAPSAPAPSDVPTVDDVAATAPPPPVESPVEAESKPPHV
jgi:sec-independent protein translocase protein TatB